MNDNPGAWLVRADPEPEDPDDRKVIAGAS
jgi:hypothetical protein